MSLASPAVSARALLLRLRRACPRHRRIGVLADGEQAGIIRRGRARMAQDLDERLLDDIGAPGWLREQAAQRRLTLPRSVEELMRL